MALGLESLLVSSEESGKGSCKGSIEEFLLLLSICFILGLEESSSKVSNGIESGVNLPSEVWVFGVISVELAESSED